MGRSSLQAKDAVGRAGKLAKLSGGSSPLTTLNTGSKGMKKISKFSSHTGTFHVANSPSNSLPDGWNGLLFGLPHFRPLSSLLLPYADPLPSLRLCLVPTPLGVLDKRPKITKGSDLDVSDILSSLGNATFQATHYKRGAAKLQVAHDTLMAQHPKEFGALLTPPSSSSTSGPKKSRGGRNQVLLEQGQAYASVAALNGASSMESASTSFAQPSIDPFALINAHLTTVINSAPPAAPGPAFVRPTKPASHKPANAAHYKHAPKSSKNSRPSSNSKRR